MTHKDRKTQCVIGKLTYYYPNKDHNNKFGSFRNGYRILKTISALTIKYIYN